MGWKNIRTNKCFWIKDFDKLFILERHLTFFVTVGAPVKKNCIVTWHFFSHPFSTGDKEIFIWLVNQSYFLIVTNLWYVLYFLLFSFLRRLFWDRIQFAIFLHIILRNFISCNCIVFNREDRNMPLWQSCFLKCHF